MRCACVSLALGLSALAGPAGAEAVLAELRADLTGDGTPDRAAILAPRDPAAADAALILWTEAGRTDVPDLVWPGHMAGTRPDLAMTPGGSLQVIARNDSIGRHRWRRTLTVAFRDGRFVLAGFTHVWRDTVTPDSHGRCEVNLLTGRGVLVRGARTAPIRMPPARTPLVAWDGAPPPACGLGG